MTTETPGTDRRHGQPIEVQVAVIATKLDQVATSVAAIDTKVDRMDAKVDSVDAKMQRIEGVVAVVRWLGVGGVAIAIVALLKAFGVEVGAP